MEHLNTFPGGMATGPKKALVRQGIESGRYNREEDALREARSLWEHSERRREEILAAVGQAEESFARGEGRGIASPEEAAQLAGESSSAARLA
jgi:Arc/MetJ-type ribon-helix-helix transcriptional regulator